MKFQPFKTKNQIIKISAITCLLVLFSTASKAQINPEINLGLSFQIGETRYIGKEGLNDFYHARDLNYLYPALISYHLYAATFNPTEFSISADPLYAFGINYGYSFEKSFYQINLSYSRLNQRTLEVFESTNPDYPNQTLTLDINAENHRLNFEISGGYRYKFIGFGISAGASRRNSNFNSKFTLRDKGEILDNYPALNPAIDERVEFFYGLVAPIFTPYGNIEIRYDIYSVRTIDTFQDYSQLRMLSVRASVPIVRIKTRLNRSKKL